MKRWSTAGALLVAAIVILAGGCITQSSQGFELDGETGCRDAECAAACRYTGYAQGGTCFGDLCVCTSSDATTDSDDSGALDTCDLDILFVIDTSGSMMDAAENLATEAFPDFATQVTAHPDLAVYRVAVTNHLYGNNEVTDGVFVQDSLFLTQGWPPEVPHEFLPCQELPSIDCDFASEESWMEGPSATLHSEFGCVGSVACHQSITMGEPTLQAGLQALNFTSNDGFLRDDALLVAVYITDEDDQSTLELSEIHHGLLALKGGDARYVVVLTLGGPEVGTEEVNPMTGAMGCMSTSYGAIEETPRLLEFSALFGAHGLHYNLCEDDISTALTAAIDALEISCHDILI